MPELRRTCQRGLRDHEAGLELARGIECAGLGELPVDLGDGLALGCAGWRGEATQQLGLPTRIDRGDARGHGDRAVDHGRVDGEQRVAGGTEGERTLLEADVSRRKRKHTIDALAAQFILQGWLDARAHAAARAGEPA